MAMECTGSESRGGTAVVTRPDVATSSVPAGSWWAKVSADARGSMTKECTGAESLDGTTVGSRRDGAAASDPARSRWARASAHARVSVIARFSPWHAGADVGEADGADVHVVEHIPPEGHTCRRNSANQSRGPAVPVRGSWSDAIRDRATWRASYARVTSRLLRARCTPKARRAKAGPQVGLA